MSSFVKLCFATLIVLICASCTNRSEGSEKFSFALMGDTQYNPREEEIFPDLLKSIDASDVKFVMHVGDFKAGSNSPCTDELYRRRFAEFNQSKHPLIYTPGDNEWVDCRRPTNGPFVPLERLQKLREIFFARPESLGKKRMPLVRQSEVFANDSTLSRYRENTLWEMGGIVFVALNVQGSNDNKGFDAANDAEHLERTKANIVWLKHAMARAQRPEVVGLVTFMQANPGFAESPETVQRSGYRDFLRAFESEAKALGKPILFAHGDTHQFRIREPYVSPLDKHTIANVTCLETYGSVSIGWVHIAVDVRQPRSPWHISSGDFSAPAASQ
jgi:Calcineurin-like phosphoesterase